MDWSDAKRGVVYEVEIDAGAGKPSGPYMLKDRGEDTIWLTPYEFIRGTRIPVTVQYILSRSNARILGLHGNGVPSYNF